MIAGTVAPRARPAARSALAPRESDQRVRRLVALAWGLLWLNVLSFTPSLSILHIPYAAGKVTAQGSLLAAFFVALAANRKLVIRPNVTLLLVSIIAADAVLTGFQAQHISTGFRIFRLVLFVITLWLLTPYWGRRDMLLVRCHLAVISAVLGSVLLGWAVAPRHAFANARLTGVIWPITATQIGHYAAVLSGLITVLWMAGKVRGSLALIAVAISATMVVLTHTRTPVVGLVISVIVATLSLVTSSARARRLLIAAGAASLVAGLAFADQLTSWMARGQHAPQIADLTGRTEVWQAMLNMPRGRFNEIFGFGLSNSSFNGLLIDSNWLTCYQELGLIGVAVCALMIIFAYLNAGLYARGERRALALLLVTYCLVASVTEVGFTNTTPYLLDLIVAASVLASSPKDSIAESPQLFRLARRLSSRESPGTTA